MVDIQKGQQKVFEIPANTVTNIIYDNSSKVDVQSLTIVNMTAAGESNPATVFFRFDNEDAAINDVNCNVIDQDLVSVDIYKQHRMNKISFISANNAKIQIFDARG